MIVLENGCPHRNRLEVLYARAGHAPVETIQIGSCHAMFASVRAGMGVALMPESTWTSLPGKDGRLVTRLIWRKGAASPLTEAFRAVLP